MLFLFFLFFLFLKKESDNVLFFNQKEEQDLVATMSFQEPKVEVVLEKFKKVPEPKDSISPLATINWAHSAVVIDSDNGKILFGKDERKKMPIASLTKIMTAIVLEEKIEDWDKEVTVSKKAAFAGGAGVHLKWEEKVKADDLFKAMLMNSDNSAAIALAEDVAGSTDDFSLLMNQKAEEIGARDSYFTEPSGLEDEKAYSTAYDFARISRYALQKEKIQKVLGIYGPLQITSSDQKILHRVGNTNLFLRDERLAFRVVGGKTGFTYNAGYCLMMGLWDKKKERMAIGVILNSGDKIRWQEMEEMLEWSFNSYDW